MNKFKLTQIRQGSGPWLPTTWLLYRPNKKRPYVRFRTWQHAVDYINNCSQRGGFTDG